MVDWSKQLRKPWNYGTLCFKFCGFCILNIKYKKVRVATVRYVAIYCMYVKCFPLWNHNNTLQLAHQPVYFLHWESEGRQPHPATHRQTLARASNVRDKLHWYPCCLWRWCTQWCMPGSPLHCAARTASISHCCWTSIHRARAIFGARTTFGSNKRNVLVCRSMI